MSYLKELQDRYKAARARMERAAIPQENPHRKFMQSLLEARKQEREKAAKAGLVPDVVAVTEALKQVSPEWVGGNHAQAMQIAEEMVGLPKLPPLPGLVLNETGAIRWMRILHAVAAYHKISPSEITGKSRKRHVTQARFEVFYRLRVDLNFSYPKIASLLKRDHSTVIHGVSKMRSMILDGIVERAEDDRLFAVNHLSAGSTHTDQSVSSPAIG